VLVCLQPHGAAGASPAPAAAAGPVESVDSNAWAVGRHFPERSHQRSAFSFQPESGANLLKADG
jgi:hypothetical protein